jgi:hypothetical protein
LGKESREYENGLGQKVLWYFVEMLDIVQLPDCEVYFQFLDEKDLAAVRRLLKLVSSATSRR